MLLGAVESETAVRGDVVERGDAILDETIRSIHASQIVVAVLCGFRGQRCSSITVLEANSNVHTVVKLWACPVLSKGHGGVGKRSEVSEQVVGQLLSCEQVGHTERELSHPATWLCHFSV